MLKNETNFASQCLSLFIIINRYSVSQDCVTQRCQTKLILVYQRVVKSFSICLRRWNCASVSSYARDGKSRLNVGNRPWSLYLPVEIFSSISGMYCILNLVGILHWILHVSYSSCCYKRITSIIFVYCVCVGIVSRGFNVAWKSIETV